MAKNRNKKHKDKKGHAASMDVCKETQDDLPQPMDTSEVKASRPGLGAAGRKIKKGITARRAKNLRKQKAMERAISNNEKVEKKCQRAKTRC